MSECKKKKYKLITQSEAFRCVSRQACQQISDIVVIAIIIPRLNKILGYVFACLVIVCASRRDFDLALRISKSNKLDDVSQLDSDNEEGFRMCD